MLNDNRQQWLPIEAVLAKSYGAATRLLRWLKEQNREDIVDVVLIVVLVAITVTYGWILD